MSKTFLFILIELQAFTTHPCSVNAPTQCEGQDCGDNLTGDRYLFTSFTIPNKSETSFTIRNKQDNSNTNLTKTDSSYSDLTKPDTSFASIN